MLSGKELMEKTLMIGTIAADADDKAYLLFKTPADYSLYITDIKIATTAAVAIDGYSYQTLHLVTGGGVCIGMFSLIDGAVGDCYIGASICLGQCFIGSGEFSTIDMFDSTYRNTSGVIVPGDTTIVLRPEKTGDGVELPGLSIQWSQKPFIPV